MPEPRSRRELLAAAVAGAAAVALGPAVGTAHAVRRGEGAALHALIAAELDASHAYRRSGIGGPFATQEDDHAQALTTMLEAGGMHAPPAPAGIDDLGPRAAALARASGDAGRRRAAIALERALIGGCSDQLPRLETPAVIRTVATVMASHAQHLAVHERAHDRDPLSSDR
jgi:hypothetical protein